MGLILKGSAIYLNLQQTLGSNLRYLMLNFPFQCNYCCLKCCNRGRISGDANQLQLPVIKELLLKASNYGIKVLVIAGEGEPLLDEFFPSTVEFANGIGLTPYIFTNGSLLTKERINFLASNNAALIINLDSLEEDNYNRYVGVKGEFDSVIKNIQNCRKVYRKKIYNIGVNNISYLAINQVVSKGNLNQTEILRAFCKDDVVFVVNQPILIGLAIKHLDNYINIGNLLPEENYPLGTLSSKHQCAYLRNGLSIGADGKIITCAYCIDTAGAYGHFSERPLTDSHKLVMRSVDDFYGKFGSGRCILRHPRYQDFLSQLKNK